VAQCDEGLAEQAESVHASEDGPEADHDEVMIRKSPSTKAKPAIQKKQGQAPADIDISNLIAKKPVGQGSTNQQPIAYNVAEILRDDQVFELADLLASDFEMPTTDKDFKLSHEQLIKVVKILLHKMNLTNRKNDYEKEDAIKRMTEKHDKFEYTCKTDVDEMKQFLHSVHHQFDKFTSK